MDDKKLFLIDAYAMIYRAYYALIRAPRVTSHGLNTSAIFGFCNAIDDMLRKENPQYLAVCFDPPGGKTFRHEAYPEYKAQRQKQPEDITVAVPYIKQILAAMNIPIVEIADYEADDIIGTLANTAGQQGFTTYMMTLDKDYGQLVTDNILMYRPSLKGQGFEIRGPKEVCDLYGISSPRQVIDLLALEGDASDNIPGCPGVGEKTATKLIAEWGSVENLLAHTDSLKGSLQRKIADNAEQILFSKFLVTIKTDVPVGITPEQLIRREPDMSKLIELYEQLEFRSFISRLNARNIIETPRQPAPPAPKTKADGMSSLFDNETAETAETVKSAIKCCSTTHTTATTTQQIAAVLEAASKVQAIGLSLTAIGDEAMTAELCGIAISDGNGTNVYIPLQPKGFGREETLQQLQPLFNNTALTIVSHDIKRDILLLQREGLKLTSPYYDTSVAHYLLKPEMRHTLDFVAFDIVGYKTSTYELPDSERRKMAKTITEQTPAQSCERACVVLELYPLLKSMIEQQGQTSLMDDIELPFIQVLAAMEWTGARIDVNELARISAELTARLSTLEERAYELAGEHFNISSPTQVGDILFGKMQIDTKAKKTKTGAWSTTEEILEKYRNQYEIVDIILKVRGLRKLLTTYIDALPKLINPVTGKIHTSYNQTVTATGRISSTNPNLQNIPIRTEDGREIRRAFIPDKGNLMMSADYSQIELRLMADFSGDPTMIDAFNSGADIHRATAAKIYHIDPAAVTDNQRRNAKTANFGIIYGISAFGLSQRLDIPRSEAKMLIDGYLATYPGVHQYMEDSIRKARDEGYVTTIKGRKRYLPDINSRNATVRGYAERNAINAPLQGSAADIIKIAMINIYREMNRLELKSHMIMQVHDELVFDVVPEEQDQLKEIVIRHMSDAYHGHVALEVSVGEGANWLEAH